MNVLKFTKPIGKYAAGDIAGFPDDDQAEAIIKRGVAIRCKADGSAEENADGQGAEVKAADGGKSAGKASAKSGAAADKGGAKNGAATGGADAVAGDVGEAGGA